MDRQYQLQFGSLVKIIGFTLVLVLNLESLNESKIIIMLNLLLCNIRGKIKGEWHNGLAKIDPDINRSIFSRINEKYGIFAHIMNLFYKIKKMDIIILYIESRD